MQRVRGTNPARQEGAAAPAPVGVLGRQERGAPAFGGHLGAFRRHLFGCGIEQVAHDLPADRGVGVEQPVNDRHTVPPAGWLRSFMTRVGRIPAAASVPDQSTVGRRRPTSARTPWSPDNATAFEETDGLRKRAISEGGCIFRRAFGLDSPEPGADRRVPRAGRGRRRRSHPGGPVRLITFARARGHDRYRCRGCPAHLGLGRELIREPGPSRRCSSSRAPDITQVMPFWRAVLGYEPRIDSPDEDLVDPLDRGAPFWFETMDEPRSDGGGAIHISVWVPRSGAGAHGVALAAGGRMVRTTSRPPGGPWPMRPATRSISRPHEPATRRARPPAS